MNPHQHCRLSVRRWGGVEADYREIHEFIDSTKTLCADGRHRILHTHWAVRRIVVPIFGQTLTNSDGKDIDVGDLCERDHLLADYGNRFVPTIGDFVASIEVDDRDALRRDIEQFHADWAGDPAIAELMLSPLTATGRIESLLITHNSWFVNDIVPRVFGGEPSIADFAIAPSRLFNAMRFSAWMDNGLDCAPSARSLDRLRVQPSLKAVP